MHRIVDDGRQRDRPAFAEASAGGASSFGTLGLFCGGRSGRVLGMAKDGFYFLAPLLLAAAAAFYWGWTWAGMALLPLALFVAYFFRDPRRTIPTDPGAIVSPADGKVIRIDEVEGGSNVCIFLSVFDVHVNRAPIGGRIASQEHRPGKFLLAFDDRASVENEQLRIVIRGEREISFSLIAGLVARRIVPWRKPGDEVERGDKIGLIRFGSRVDILMPAGCRLAVRKGDRVKGGSSILGHWE